MSRISGRERRDCVTQSLGLSTEELCVLHVVRTCLSVLGTLGTLSLRRQSFISVCTTSPLESRKAPANLRAGFMTKIKKLLEMVCHNCGKILVDEVGHPLGVFHRMQLC